MKQIKLFEVNLEFTPKFWAIIPALNINISSKTLEFEWLCFGLYFDFAMKDKNPVLERRGGSILDLSFFHPNDKTI